MTDIKMLALDTEDLEILSAHCQDAIVRVGDMAYAKSDRRFACFLNRFAWEDDAASRKTRGIRKRAALRIDRVLSSQVSGIDLKAEEGVLELLSILFTEGEAPGGAIELAFAGGGTIRLEVECIDVRLRDFGAAWAAKARPAHVLDDGRP